MSEVSTIKTVFNVRFYYCHNLFKGMGRKAPNPNGSTSIFISPLGSSFNHTYLYKDNTSFSPRKRECIDNVRLGKEGLRFYFLVKNTYFQFSVSEFLNLKLKCSFHLSCGFV